MAFTARAVIQSAQLTLQDAGSTRWLLPELLGYLNAGVREVALQKPNATAKTVTFELIAGTEQKLPAGYHRLLSVIRNVDGGRAVTPVVREILDMQIPGWHNTAVLPYNKTVMHVMDDPFDTYTFHVCPGNDGTGQIVVIASELPAPVDTPSNPMDIEAYGENVPLGDIYQNALVDYVLYRAFSKDINVPGAAQRAPAHYQLFQQALGIRQQQDMTQNVDTPKSRFSQ